jgi:hypothetical protein
VWVLREDWRSRNRCEAGWDGGIVSRWGRRERARSALAAFSASLAAGDETRDAVRACRGRCAAAKLKDAPDAADEPRMFLRLSEPILLTEEGLDGLCTSLNRPVVDLEHLPVGPARAAIVVHRGADGQRSLSVALRSVESGAVLSFGFQGELDAGASRAMDTGLTFAESMGFLFDDDMLGGANPADAEVRRRAFAAWCQMSGEELPPAAVGRAAVATADPFDAPLDDEDDDGDAMLLLDDLADLIDEELDGDPSPAPADPERTPGEDRVVAPEGAAVLSKFRRPQEADPEPEAGQAQLGRIPLVRKRQAEEGASTPPLLSRLLARF